MPGKLTVLSLGYLVLTLTYCFMPRRHETIIHVVFGVYIANIETTFFCLIK